MEMFVHQCTSCQSSVKYSRDKAGQKTKCPKCGAELMLPMGEDNRPGDAGDDDEGGGYGLAVTDDVGDKKKREEAQNKKAEKKAAPRIKVRRKNIGELDAWRRVYNGLLFLMIGACVWGAAFGLQALVVFLGMIQGPEIGRNAEQHLFAPEPVVVPGAAPALNKPMFFLSMVSGSDFINTAQVLMIVSQVLMFIMTALWMVGYGMCLSVENRMGTTGQLITLFSLGGTNAVLNLFFRFLPLVGAIGYVLVPFFAAELPMGEINTERAVPVQVTWCRAPVWEIILTLIVQLVLMLEPIMIGVFIWTIAQMVRDEPVELKALGLIKMGFGILFLLLAYHMYAVAGTSSVLIKLLRVIYLLWFCFQIGFIVRLATTCHAARELLNFYLNPDK